ncbi:MAG: hypothetical protein U9Q90_01070 [Campylobacterota bacterium]|nr:hypothetical protein [Campylobacterota bacterium]
MKNLKILLVLFSFSILLSGCNIYVDSGRVTKGTTAGYKQYRNKTINISVLTPDGWDTSVGIGGEYAMISPDPKRSETRRPAIYISSSPIDFLSITGAPTSMDGTSEVYKKSRLPLSTTLEEFKNNRLAFITEENIGPRLRVSVKKSRLANHDAYEISYSYKAKELPQRRMVQETFTLVNGRVYRLTYYADEDVYSKFLKELQVVKSSYRILK